MGLSAGDYETIRRQVTMGLSVMTGDCVIVGL